MINIERVVEVRPVYDVNDVDVGTEADWTKKMGRDDDSLSSLSTYIGENRIE